MTVHEPHELVNHMSWSSSWTSLHKDTMSSIVPRYAWCVRSNVHTNVTIRICPGGLSPSQIIRALPSLGWNTHKKLMTS